MKQTMWVPLLLALAAGPAMAGSVSEQTTNTAGVTRIEISGDTSSIAIKAGGNAPFVTTLRGERHGAISSWLPKWLRGDCTTASTIAVDGSVLRIVAKSQGDDDACEVTVDAHVPAGASLSVTHGAISAHLAGDFSTVDIRSKATEFVLGGYARAVDIDGAAIHARLAYDHSEKAERVRIRAPSVSADVAFAKGVPISYEISGRAASVTASRLNTPGAQPALEVSGTAVHAVIR